MSSIDDKKKALALVLEKMDKTYGKGTVMKMGDSAVEEVEVIPSGSLGLDIALGVGCKVACDAYYFGGRNFESVVETLNPEKLWCTCGCIEYARLRTTAKMP
jgi:hypothetical protein